MPAKPTERDPKVVSVRLPLALWKRIAAIAETQRRSIHNQMLVLLEQAVAREEETRSSAAQPPDKRVP
jgi:hypothetical protein